MRYEMQDDAAKSVASEFLFESRRDNGRSVTFDMPNSEDSNPRDGMVYYMGGPIQGFWKKKIFPERFFFFSFFWRIAHGGFPPS